MQPRGTRALTAAALGVLLLAGCGPQERAGTVSASASSSPSAAAPPSDAAAPSYAVADPGPMHGRLHTADLLVTSRTTIPDAVRRKVAAVHGVAAVMPLSVASMSSNGRTLTIAAGDPGRFRAFTPVQSAQADDVWSRVAGGEVAVDATLPRGLADKAGYLSLGAAKDAPQVHVGAYAPLVRQISAFVDEKRAAQIGMVHGNALLVSTGSFTPSALKGKIARAVGGDATLQTLALEFNVDVPQTAVLTGGSVAQAVGSFHYTPHADGRVTPDAAWVRSYIRTETVPIIGSVTCNKVMVVQLRAALEEVVQRGLADRIHPGEYGGCYYPRYIAYDPANGLSLHTWGIAVDLNVAENQRGTVGAMDRQVVAIFKKWGFAWGGDWHYTDPMHFEMDALVRPH